MTIVTAKNTPRVTYTATANQTAFTIPFEFFSTSDIKVYNGTSLLTYNASPSSTSQYSITGTASASDSAFEFGSGGTVTLGSTGASVGDIITIIRDISIERTSDFPTSGSFDVTSLNTDLDKIYAKLADIDQQSDRSVKLLDTDSISATVTLPAKASRASKVMTFTSDGDVETTINSVDVTTIAGISSDVTTVSGIASDVTTVAADGTDIGTVAGISSNVTTVAGISSDVTTVAGISANVTTVAGKASLITSDFAADMSLVTSDFVSDMALVTADFVSDVNTLATADIVNDLNLLATSDFVSDLNQLATTDFVSDLNALEAIKANVTSVANNESNINSAVSNESNINSAVSNASNINAVAGSITNVNSVASNLSGVNDFADRYRVVSTDPSSDNDEGDLIYNTTSNLLKVFTNSSFSTINTSGGLATISEDTTPQLGGNLNADSNNITNLGTVNTHTIPGGTGTFALTSDLTFTTSSTDTLTNKTINTASNTITIVEADISDLGSYITASSTDTLTNKSGNVSMFTNDSAYITASSTDTLTNKSGNISMFTNDSNFITASSTDTLTNKTATDLVVTTASGAQGLDVISTDAGTNGAEVEVYHNSSSPADNDNAGFISVRSNNDAAEKTTMTQIRTTVEDVSDGTEDARLSFFCMKAGTLTENARIESDGDFHSDGDVVAFSTTISDVALKSDIEMIPNALDKIDEVRGVTFTRHNGQKSAGIIAQELEKVLPEAVREKNLALLDGKTYKTVEYDAIHGLLINCIKELKDQIKELKDGFTK